MDLEWKAFRPNEDPKGQKRLSFFWDPLRWWAPAKDQKPQWLLGGMENRFGFEHPEIKPQSWGPC